MPEDVGLKNAQSVETIALSRPLDASNFQRLGALKG